MLADFTRGLPPAVVEWFLHSNDPKAVENRRIVRARYAAEIDAANRRQAVITQNMKDHAPDQKSDMRFVACIDPVIAQDFRNRYGSECLNDRKFLEDCKKKAPQLFYPK